MLFHGFSISNLEVFENGFSDHKSILFSIPFIFDAPKSINHARRSRRIMNATKNAFSLAFHDVTIKMEDCLGNMSAEVAVVYV